MKLRVAIEGCCHGELDAIYRKIEQMEATHGKPDILLICGDFQSVRDRHDLDCLTCPPKFRKMHDFHKYSDGTKTAPILTVFVGGNHEATNVLRDLYYGGWVAPNIFYLGHSGVINYKGLRIGGLSGIFNKHNYFRGYFEFAPPYHHEPPRSAYHYRAFELLKLAQLHPRSASKCLDSKEEFPAQTRLDFFLSHDWPAGIEQFGDSAALIRKKPFFEEEIRSCTLGSEPLWTLLMYLQPKRWCSAHLHCRFEASVACGSVRQSPFDPFHPQTITQNSKENGNVTQFLALDKVGWNKEFLEIVEVEIQEDNEIAENDDNIYMDPHWMAVQSANAHLFPRRKEEEETLIAFPLAQVVSKALESPPLVFKKNIEGKDAWNDLEGQRKNIERALGDLIGGEALDVGFSSKESQRKIEIKFNQPIEKVEAQKKETGNACCIGSSVPQSLALSNEEAAKKFAAEFLDFDM